MSETQTVMKMVMRYDPKLPSWHNIHNILEEARKIGKEGEVAHHLIGASLQFAFPDFEINNRSFNSETDTLGKPGDYFIGDTAFYVTIAPLITLFERYLQNLQSGYGVYLLVPERAVTGARQNAELMVPGRIAVESIESFIGQNIEELSYFTRDKLKNGFRRLLETYNGRVDAAETDKWMLIEIPRNL